MTHSSLWTPRMYPWWYMYISCHLQSSWHLLAMKDRLYYYITSCKNLGLMHHLQQVLDMFVKAWIKVVAIHVPAGLCSLQHTQVSQEWLTKNFHNPITPKMCHLSYPDLNSLDYNVLVIIKRETNQLPNKYCLGIPTSFPISMHGAWPVMQPLIANQQNPINTEV